LNDFNLIHKIVRRIIGNPIVSFRPNGKNINDLKWIIENFAIQNNDYLMFMLHSSEFMPGGSPNFKTGESIENLFGDIECIFEMLKTKSFVGVGLTDYSKAVN
jgi:hypothetical protein